VPLELACMEATHLTSMACKVSATDCSDAGSGKRRGRQVKQLTLLLILECAMGNNFCVRLWLRLCFTSL